MRSRMLARAMALAALGALPAGAADMPVKAPLPFTPLPFTWAGWHVGINGGYGWGDPSVAINPAGVAPPAATTLVAAGAPFMLSNAPQGGVIGLQIGRTWQSERMVYGFELDVDYAMLKDSADGAFSNAIDFLGDAGNTFANAQFESRMTWLATLRGRFGYSFDRVLPYVTAGAAVAHMKSTITISGQHTVPGPPFQSFVSSATVNDTLWGYAVGGGMDWGVDPRWVLRGEYLFLAFPDKTHGAVMPGVTSLQNGMDVQIARVALNYRIAP